jgi:hypothetical protein
MAAKVKYQDIPARRNAIRRLLDYEHPDTLQGLNNDITDTLIRCDRQLRDHASVADEGIKELRKRFGQPRGDDFEVPKGTDAYTDFSAEARAFLQKEVEVTITFRRSDCWTRDINGERVQANPRGSVWMDLGELLMEETAAAEHSPAAGRSGATPGSRARARRPKAKPKR